MPIANALLENHLREIFKDEYPLYEASLNKPLHKAMLINTQYCDPIIPFDVTPNPFGCDHYRFDPSIHLSDYGLYYGGAWYGQEASAACAVSVLDPKCGESVLDCCAAPGGKSLQIALKIKESGLLVSNEYDPKRASILRDNIDSFGLTNTIVTQGDVSSLTRTFDQCFDKVLVDAPCSGEGMFKKEDAALDQWSLSLVKQCAKRQLAILSDAAKMVRLNGTLVYSTCTFAMEENEATIAAFLKSHPDFILEPITVSWGRPGFDVDDTIDLTKTRRIFPMDDGEGHFVAKLKRIDGQTNPLPSVKSKPLTQSATDMIRPWYNGPIEHLFMEKDHIVYTQSKIIDTARLHVLRNYLPFAQFLKNRIEPLYPLSHCPLLHPYIQRQSLDLRSLNDYLHGQTIKSTIEGWSVVTYHNYGIGWIKTSGSMGKNHFPKHRRIHHTVV